MSRFISQQGLEPVKEESASGIAILMVERGENLVKHRRRPLSLVNLISCQGLDWFQVETLMFGNLFKRDWCFAVATLCRHRSVSLVGEEMLKRREHVGSQSPFLPARCLEI